MSQNELDSESGSYCESGGSGVGAAFNVAAVGTGYDRFRSWTPWPPSCAHPPKLDQRAPPSPNLRVHAPVPPQQPPHFSCSG